MKLLKPRARIETREHRLSFTLKGQGSAGFCFLCDAEGVVDVAALNPAARENYLACARGEIRGEAVNPPAFSIFDHAYWEPAQGSCDDCGARVVLSGFTNTCACGADYNSAGQRLAAREHWGSETGEHPVDIGRIP